MDEIKHERFRKVAEKRVNQVLADLDKLGNCSSKVSYDYTEAEVNMIFEALEQAVFALQERFAGRKSFSLRD